MFFKMTKHHLNLEKEVQLRDFDGIIVHINIVMVRYIFLAVKQRYHDDQRTIGGLLFTCSQEVKNLSLIGALAETNGICLGQNSVLG